MSKLATLEADQLTNVARWYAKAFALPYAETRAQMDAGTLKISAAFVRKFKNTDPNDKTKKHLARFPHFNRYAAHVQKTTGTPKRETLAALNSGAIKVPKKFAESAPRRAPRKQTAPRKAKQTKPAPVLTIVEIEPIEILPTQLPAA